jgi:hypothetical protein
MDTAAFSEVRFREASSLCESLIGSISASNKQSLTPLPLAIIPSAIDCINEIGHNLYVRTKEFDWYKGATVAETLQEFATRSSQLSRSKDLPLVLCIRKTYDKPYVRPKGLVLEGKIMSGAIKDQERVKIVPVGTKAFGWVALTGHIAELRKIAEPARISIGSAGDMISANCTDLRFRGKSITREQMNVGPSSLILKESTQCDVGTVAVFSIDRVPAVGLGVLEQVLLIWFGRSIPAHVVAIDLDNGKIFIEAEQDPLGVALDEESVPLHRDFVIRQQTGSTSGSPEGQRPARYIPIQLEQVGTPERLAYSGSDLFSVEEIKNRHWHSPVERTETGVLFNAPIGYEMLLREIKMFETEVGDRGRAILRQMRVSLGPPDRM